MNEDNNEVIRSHEQKKDIQLNGLKNEDNKEVIRSHEQKKDIQHNGLKNETHKDSQWSPKHFVTKYCVTVSSYT